MVKFLVVACGHAVVLVYAAGEMEAAASCSDNGDSGEAAVVLVHAVPAGSAGADAPVDGSLSPGARHGAGEHPQSRRDSRVDA